MAIRQVRIGSAENIHQYDDADFTEAADFDDQPIKIGPSTAADEAIREDQVPSLGDIVSASANIGDNEIVRGDGGAKGIQGSGLLLDDSDNLTKTDDLEIDCGANKTIELVQPVWKDINLGAARLSLFGLLTGPDYDEFKDSTGADVGVETYAFAVGEEISGLFEMQHDYKEGSDFTPHIHWQGIAAPTGTDKVQWELEYTISRSGQVLQPTTTITVESNFDTQYEFVKSNWSAIDGSTAGHGGGNVQIGDQFMFRLERIAASSDEYGGDALIATIGIHYQIDTIGSRQITTK